MDQVKKAIIQEYDPNYCGMLEFVYGPGMMSEGGPAAIEFMFEGIPLEGKSAVDIGSGLGGVAIYLAENYKMKIAGLEINPWMVAESLRRTPRYLKGKLQFIQSDDDTCIDLPGESFDIVYSKGALVHFQEKMNILQESWRLLIPGGFLVINDWLSSKHGQWGENVQKMIDLEGLTLFADTEERYLMHLKQCGFTETTSRNDSQVFEMYNRSIVQKLKTPDCAKRMVEQFGEGVLKDNIDGYTAIAEAMRTGELQVLNFIARKPD